VTPTSWGQFPPRPRWAEEGRFPAPHEAEQGSERGRRPARLANVVWLATGLGACLDAIAITFSPHDYGMALSLFWLAIAVPFAVFASVLLAGRLSQGMRGVTVALAGVYPAFLYRMSSPLVLSGFDEHLHERTLLDLLRGSGLFAPNPMLPISPDYPGMEIFTGVTIRLTGVPVILGEAIVVLLCRLLLVLIIYQSSLTVSPSRRVASLVVLFYAMSPQFYFFNAQFAYQTMALTLGLGGLLLLRRAQVTEGNAARRLTLLAIVALIGTVVTHHITSWFVLAFLIAWAVVTPRGRRRNLVSAAAAMGLLVVVWTAGIAAKMVNYLGPVFAAALQQFEALVGGGKQRQLFSTSAGSETPQWQREVLILYAGVCTCVAIGCGVILLRRALRYRDGRLGLLGLLSIGYPSTLAAHFVPTAASVGDRASTFFFLPLALSVALVILRDPRVQPDQDAPDAIWDRRRAAWLVVLVPFATVIYVGALSLGGGPNWQYLPGPYLVSADSRSQDAETLAATKWAAMHLPAGSRIVADRVPSDLLADEARLWPVTAPTKTLQPASLYFSGAWTSYQTSVVRELHIRYIYVDRRLSESLPQEGYYIYPGETPKPERMSLKALTKFSHVPGLKAVYHEGPISIYSTAGLGVKQELDGFTGNRPMGLGRLGDALWGAAMALLAWRLRRRLTWFKHAARDASAIGMAVVVMAATLLAGAVLFELRIMPGWSFTIGAALAGTVALAIQHHRTRRRVAVRLQGGAGSPASTTPGLTEGLDISGD
jgi:hypothetical protein